VLGRESAASGVSDGALHGEHHPSRIFLPGAGALQEKLLRGLPVFIPERETSALPWPGRVNGAAAVYGFQKTAHMLAVDHPFPQRKPALHPPQVTPDKKVYIEFDGAGHFYDFLPADPHVTAQPAAAFRAACPTGIAIESVGKPLLFLNVARQIHQAGNGFWWLSLRCPLMRMDEMNVEH
jgi:hypothetical protein